MSNHDDIIDQDLYEDLDEEEMNELALKAQEEALEKARLKKDEPKKPPFPKWVFWLIALALAFNIVALLPQTLSIPAIKFLVKSTELSKQADIKLYKKSVAVIQTDESKGTGFVFSKDGHILTNNHVVEGEDYVTVGIPEAGVFDGEVTFTAPEIDLAVIKVETEKDLSYLKLAEKPEYTLHDPIYFIGNPLNFNGIANEGSLLESIHLSDWEKPVVMLDAPVYRGNSGSPVINKSREVTGVIFATTQVEEHGKVGLFVPIDYFHEIYTKDDEK